MRDAQGKLPKSNNMFNVSKLQSAGGKLTELLEQNYSIHCDQNNSKMILSHGKYFFFRKTLSTSQGGITEYNIPSTKMYQQFIRAF